MTILFDRYIGPYQVLPLRARVNQGALAMKEYSAFSQSSSITRASLSESLVSYAENSLWRVFDHFAEMQSVYSTAPADWAIIASNNYS